MVHCIPSNEIIEQFVVRILRFKLRRSLNVSFGSVASKILYTSTHERFARCIYLRCVKIFTKIVTRRYEQLLPGNVESIDTV